MTEMERIETFYFNAILDANQRVYTTLEKWLGTVNPVGGDTPIRASVAATCNGIREAYAIEPTPDSSVKLEYNENDELVYTPFQWQTATEPPIPLDEPSPSQSSGPT